MIKDQEMPYFLTFQVVGWVDVFTRGQDVKKSSCGRFWAWARMKSGTWNFFLILENLTFCRKEKGLYLYGYVVMSNHLHLVVLQKDGELSVYFKKFSSKKLLNSIKENNQESRKEWMDMVFRYHAKYNNWSERIQFWTHDNHAIELYRTEMIKTRMNYIHENPVRGLDVKK